MPAPGVQSRVDARALESAQARLGVVMLNTRFPRVPGDIGNRMSFPFPTRYRRVRQASVARTVQSDGPDPALARALTDATHALVAEGCTVVATSCGFLAPLQNAFERFPVPAIASALAFIPHIRAVHHNRPIGILTFDSRRLGLAHLGSPGAIRIMGLESGRTLYPTIAEGRRTLDRTRALHDVVSATRRLLRADPAIAALVLECTNLVPYRNAIARVSRKPVYDINLAISALASGPRPFHSRDPVLRLLIEHFRQHQRGEHA